MREVEFRARDWHDKEWVYFKPGYLVLFKYGTLQQWTGLTDKTGIRIYEGDIVAFTDKPLVERSHEHGGPKKPRIIKWTGNGYNLRRVKNSVAMGVEIIGNIYEPPKPSPLKEKE